MFCGATTAKLTHYCRTGDVEVTRIHTIILIFFGSLGLLSGSFAADVVGVRVWPAPDKTRVVFDLSGPVNYQTFTIEGPSRVVIDLKNSKAKKAHDETVRKNNLLKGMRSAPQKGGHRFVLDLRRQVHVNSFQLKPTGHRGHRLVVDLYDKANVPAQLKQPIRQSKPLPASEMPARAIVSQPGNSQIKPQQKKPIETKPVYRDLIVAIDAGHGGQDPGALGKRGTKEKDVVLAISRKLAKKIDATPGMRAVLTRNSDIFLPLRKRMEIARDHHADLFISIHADAFKNHNVQGSSVYVLSEHGASSEAAKWLAEKENAADFIGGVKLDNKDKLLKEVLLDLSQNAVQDASMNVASKVLGGLRKVGKIHKPEVQHAGFMVLKSPDIPSVLIETAFISNPSEERKLLHPGEQNLITDAILAGIKNYFQEYAPPGTRLAAR